jgi:2-polyprenyl-6-hydroxyphenyl methylase/3-demethylubiquinone-9 3-methyltransferase
MNHLVEPVCATQTPCKCCAATASLYGVVDFHKNCEMVRRQVLELSGIPIYYYRCPNCRFIFTTAFDHFTDEDFRRCIYNDDYVRVDPDYLQRRPRANANFLCRLLAGPKPNRILDYGGGNGLLAEVLRAGGFAQTDTYDPSRAIILVHAPSLPRRAIRGGRQVIGCHQNRTSGRRLAPWNGLWGGTELEPSGTGSRGGSSA